VGVWLGTRLAERSLGSAPAALATLRVKAPMTTAV